MSKKKKDKSKERRNKGRNKYEKYSKVAKEIK